MKSWIAVVLFFGACSAQAPKETAVAPGPFDPKVHSAVVAECYMAYLYRGTGNEDYDLRLPPEQVKALEDSTIPSAERMNGHHQAAVEELGGEVGMAKASSAWLRAVRNQISAGKTPQERQKRFNALLVAKAEGCEAQIERWNKASAR